MRERESLQDKELTCQDCGEKFIFTVGEQQFFAEHQFTPPKRCSFCRQLLRQKRKALEGGRREVRHEG